MKYEVSHARQHSRHRLPYLRICHHTKPLLEASTVKSIQAQSAMQLSCWSQANAHQTVAGWWWHSCCEWARLHATTPTLRVPVAGNASGTNLVNRHRTVSQQHASKHCPADGATQRKAQPDLITRQPTSRKHSRTDTIAKRQQHCTVHVQQLSGSCGNTRGRATVAAGHSKEAWCALACACAATNRQSVQTNSKVAVDRCAGIHKRTARHVCPLHGALQAKATN
jgi:hypothetical protein